MKKYLNMQTQHGAIGVIGIDEEGKSIEIIQAGTTISRMPVKYKSQYESIESKKDIYFIFDDFIPQFDFYAVPRIDFFARDNHGGYYGTVGATTDIENLDAPICYINKSLEIFKVSSCLKEFVFPPNTGNKDSIHMEPISDLTLCSSFQEAREQFDFIDIEY